VNSAASIYRLAAVDIFRTDAKASHVRGGAPHCCFADACAPQFRRAPASQTRNPAPSITQVARYVGLPPARAAVRVGDVALPPLLIFNLQLPRYPAGFFGPGDGAGESVVSFLGGGTMSGW